ncbi:unnamed protein product, partial [Lampetra planeri]
MLSLDGLEVIAVLVVMGLFIKVLEQFGMFEPVGGEGNPSTSQSKKTIKQRFLKLLPCCKPTAAPSISQSNVEDDFELSTVCHRPESMDKLQEQTKFTKKELQVLYRGFKNECPSGAVNEENFKIIYSQFFPQG